MHDEAARLQERILGDIPLARHIGVRVLDVSADRLVLAAALGPNSNHRGTAFGGSLFSLAVLAGWGLLTLKLSREGMQGDIVIQDSEVKYLHPVTGDFVARALLEDPVGFERLLGTLKRYGRARTRLRIVVEQDGRPAVALDGTYAVVAAAIA